MNFPPSITVSFGVIFILALAWVVGVGVLIVKKNNKKLTPEARKAQLASRPNEDDNFSILKTGSTSPGVLVNPLDGDARKQHDMTPDIETDHIEPLFNADILRYHSR